MKTKGIFGFGLPVILLVLGLTLGGCPTDGGEEDPFVAVTGIAGVQTASLVNIGLTLSGTVEPSNATNKTIVWSGAGVSNGVLKAPSAGEYTVTATIVNGTNSGSYTKSFKITAYPAGTVGAGVNPFGDDDTPVIWTMDDTGGTVYVTLTDKTWLAMAEGTTYNSGTYSHITGTKAAQWTVTGGGHYIGNTGLAIFIEDDTILVANFSHEYSDMNGTFTKLNPELTLEGTWISDNAPFYGDYAKIVAADGNFTVSAGDNAESLTNKVKGTYPTPGEEVTTNPVVCTVTHIYISDWVELAPEHLDSIGGSATSTGFIYEDRFETYGATFIKQGGE